MRTTVKREREGKTIGRRWDIVPRDIIFPLEKKIFFTVSLIKKYFVALMNSRIDPILVHNLSDLFLSARSAQLIHCMRNCSWGWDHNLFSRWLQMPTRRKSPRHQIRRSQGTMEQLLAVIVFVTLAVGEGEYIRAGNCNFLVKNSLERLQKRTFMKSSPFFATIHFEGDCLLLLILHIKDIFETRDIC